AVPSPPAFFSRQTGRVLGDDEDFHQSGRTSDGRLHYRAFRLIDMTPPKHILGTFDEGLSSLRNNVLMMAGLAERTLDRAIKGLLQRDDNLCVTAIADDEEIDQLRSEIDKDGIDVLLRFQPVASDLRRVVAAMKLSPNIERIADQATNNARRARKLNRHPPLPEVEIIVPIQAHAMAMFKDSIDAFVREDVDLGRAVVLRDKELDYMNKMAN